jgi:hypothetical protein
LNCRSRYNALLTSDYAEDLLGGDHEAQATVGDEEMELLRVKLSNPTKVLTKKTIVSLVHREEKLYSRYNLVYLFYYCIFISIT